MPAIPTVLPPMVIAHHLRLPDVLVGDAARLNVVSGSAAALHGPRPPAAVPGD